MKVKRTIKLKPFKEYFKLESPFNGLRHSYHWNTPFFNPFSFSVMAIILSSVLGFLSPLFWAIGLAYLALLIYLYFKTARIAQGLLILRKVPNFAREKEKLKVIYVVSNETAFKIEEISFLEHFDGIQSQEYVLDIKRPIPARTRFEMTKELTLDAGMGVKTFNPFSITIRDEIGLFEFQVTYNQIQEIEVYPLIESTPVLKTSISPESIEYGMYEIAKRGDSNLFIGTRDYRHGDPVKNINWKLTKKMGKVIVNEYEKNTNSFVTLILDLQEQAQSGAGSLSTWEAVKDIALSITENEIAKNNQVQLITGQIYVPFGTGKNQFSTIERHLTYHELTQKQDMKEQYLDQLQALPERSQVYFICPMITTPQLTITFDVLLNLRLRGHRVTIIAVDALEELQKHLTGMLRAGLMEIDKITKERFQQYEINFRNLEIPIITVKIKQQMRLYDQLLKNAQGWLE